MPNDNDDEIKSKNVKQRPDGFFAVEGQSEETYYADRDTAERVAMNLAVRDSMLKQHSK